MNDIEQVGAGALAPSDYATYELAKQNDGVIASIDIAQIRTYSAALRANAEGIRAFIANATDTDEINDTKAEMNETAMTCSRVSMFCDVRIGELLSEIPTKQGKRTDITSMSVPKEVTKAQILKEAGIDVHTASDLEKLAANVDIVEAVINDCEENGKNVSRNMVLKAIKESETSEVRTCRKCGVELTDENTYPSQRPGNRYHANICKHCHDDKSVIINNDAPQWTIDTLIADLTANSPAWRNTAMNTFAMYAECGVNVSQKSINAINMAFDELDTAIAGIVEG